ncbi:dirigent protein 1-like [Salvia miltiorrhiza]|uniref:dirigent protein 1-like n=1 Tax=Salvia miltiorrhiza TaxID=226208 RepID=UPI0025ABA47E|nr:dirigent protein 1-like [Salvia miltiorrhiza]
MMKFHMVLVLVYSFLIVASGNYVTKFHVYVHEVVSGPNATLYEVARANITGDSPTSFGLVRVADDLMTSGPDMDTGKLGRAQGLVVNSGLTESSTMLTLDFVFTAGKYRGSTIIATGRKRLTNGNQELPIVGGTAAFRLARGYVISNYTYNAITNTVLFIFDFSIYLD